MTTRESGIRSWLTLKLGDAAEFQNGGAWKEAEYAASGVPVVRVTNCTDGTVDFRDCKFLALSSYPKYAKHELKKDDLIVATVGSHPTQPGSVVGRTSIVPRVADGALLNQNAVRLRANPGVMDQSFLNYVAKTAGFRKYIIAHARGAANQVRMSIGLLKEMPIPQPPLSVQRRVASILSAYDDLIENNTRRIAIP
jgi:type I restriction enzyme, S subunit